MLAKENVLLAGALPVLLPKLNVALPFVDPPPNANGVALVAAAGLLPIVLVPKEKPPAPDLFPAAANRFGEALLLLAVFAPPKLNVLLAELLLAPASAPNVLLLLATLAFVFVELPPNIDLVASLVVVALPKLNAGFVMLAAAVGAGVAAPNIFADGVLLALIAAPVDAPKLNPPAGALLPTPVEVTDVDLLAVLPPNAKGVDVVVVVVAPNADFADAALLTAPNVEVAPWLVAAPKVNAPGWIELVPVACKLLVPAATLPNTLFSVVVDEPPNANRLPLGEFVLVGPLSDLTPLCPKLKAGLLTLPAFVGVVADVVVATVLLPPKAKVVPVVVGNVVAVVDFCPPNPKILFVVTVGGPVIAVGCETVAPPKEKAGVAVVEAVLGAVLVVVPNANGFVAASVGPLNVLLIAILPKTLDVWAVDTVESTDVVGLVAPPKLNVPEDTVLKAVAVVVLAVGADAAMPPPKLNAGFTTAAVVLIVFVLNVNVGFAASEETGFDVGVVEFPKLPKAGTADTVVTVVEASAFGANPNLNPPALAVVELAVVVVVGAAVVEVVLVEVPNENP